MFCWRGDRETDVFFLIGQLKFYSLGSLSEPFLEVYPSWNSGLATPGVPEVPEYDRPIEAWR